MPCATLTEPGACASWTYDLADRPSSVTYPSGTIVNYVRDSMGRVATVNYRLLGTGPLLPVVSSASYLPFGPLHAITFGNGRTLTKTFDLNYAIDTISTNPGNGLTADYDLDVVGNISGLSDVLGGPPTRKYQYDALHRLRWVRDQADAVVEGFAYDAVGNRTSKQVGQSAAIPYTYPLTSHRLASVGGVARSYDSAGNTSAIGARSLGYDQRNRLTTYISGTGATGSYAYNGRGERVAKSATLQATQAQPDVSIFSYDQTGRLLAEGLLPQPDPCVCPPGHVCTDICGGGGESLVVTSKSSFTEGGPQWRDYIYIDDLPIAVLDSSGLRYLESDHLGTPRVAVDSLSNTPVWRWDPKASAFGENAPNESPGGGTPYRLDLRFPGQYRDAESGLHYNYFRDYEPATGRYIESDLIGLGGGINTYAYTGGRPLFTFDPFGLASFVGFPPDKHEAMKRALAHAETSLRKCKPGRCETPDPRFCLTDVDIQYTLAKLRAATYMYSGAHPTKCAWFVNEGFVRVYDGAFTGKCRGCPLKAIIAHEGAHSSADEHMSLEDEEARCQTFERECFKCDYWQVGGAPSR